MREFFIGLLVLLSLLILSVLGIVMLPFILVMSVFLQWIVYLLFGIFAIWLVGKITVVAFGYLRRDRSVEIIDQKDYERRHRDPRP